MGPSDIRDQDVDLSSLSSLRTANLQRDSNNKDVIFYEYFYHPQMKLLKGYVFTPVCHSVHRGVSAPVHAGIHPPGRHPPGR